MGVNSPTAGLRNPFRSGWAVARLPRSIPIQPDTGEHRNTSTSIVPLSLSQDNPYKDRGRKRQGDEQRSSSNGRDLTDNDRKIRVVLDVMTFGMIEELLEDCGLALSMEEVEEEESLSLNEAQEYYAQMKKR